MKTWLRAAAPSFCVAAVLGEAVPAFAQPYVDVQDIAAPTSAAELVVSPSYGVLVLKNTASTIAAIDIATAAVSLHSAVHSFTDMSLSPDGRYLYAADYGGENIGYGTPLHPSSVHRLDLSNGSWSMEGAVIAGNVQATGATTLILKSIDQWVTFTDNAWTGNTNLTQLNVDSNSVFPGFYATVYEGNFRYAVPSGRLIHGSSGESSQEIHAFTIVNGNFVAQETTGIYGSAQGFGPNVALATDGSVFYYGALAVDALDVTHTLHVYPETIYAANGDVAFGDGDYYDAHSGGSLGSIGFQATVYAPSPCGADFWVYDGAANMLRHFASTLADGGSPCSAGPVDAGEAIDAGYAVDAASATDATTPVDAASATDATTPVDAASATDSIAADDTASTVDATAVVDAPITADVAKERDASADVDASAVAGSSETIDSGAPPFSDTGIDAAHAVQDASPEVIVLERGGCACALGPDGADRGERGERGTFAVFALALLGTLRRRRRH